MHCELKEQISYHLANKGYITVTFELSAKSYIIELPWIKKLASSQKIRKNQPVDWTFSCLKTNTSLHVWYFKFGWFVCSCSSTNNKQFEILFIALISHISKRFKQTFKKCTRKKCREIFSFWFQVLRAGKIWDEQMGKVLRLKLGIRFPVSAYLPDCKPCSGLSKSLWIKPICLTADLAQDYQTLQSHFLEFLLFFHKREILTCVLVLCGFCTFSNSMSAQLYVDEAIWPKLGTAPRPFDQNITGGISTSLLFKRPTHNTFLLLAQILPAHNKYTHYSKIQFLIMKKVASKEIFLYCLFEKRHFPRIDTAAGSCHNLERVSICECVHQKDSNKLHS